MTVKQAMDRAYKLGVRTKNGNRLSWQSTKNMLANPLYAGFVCTKFTDDKYIKGVHKAIVSPFLHYKVKSLVDRQFRKVNRNNSDEYPLRGGFLCCYFCGGALTGNAPRGRGNKHYPRYSCTDCRRSEEIKATSKNREDVHAEFLDLLKVVRPKAGVAKVFKEVVLRNWNDEFKHTVDYNKTLSNDLNAIRLKKSKIIDLFIDGALSEEDKDAKLNELETKVTQLELKKADNDQDVKDKEQVVDSAVTLLTHPDEFWNLGSLEVKKRLQELVFPGGISYDLSTGVRTAQLNSSYLLMKNIALSSDKNPNLVAGAGLEPATLWL